MGIPFIMRFLWFNPISLAFKWIRWQGDTLASLMGIKSRPVHWYSGKPKLAQGVQ